MKKTNSAQGIKLAILGAALVASGAAFAADSSPAHRGHDRAGHHAFHHQHGHHGFHKSHGFHHGAKGMRGQRHGQMHRAGLIVPGYGVVSRDFVAGMGLNDDQLKLIDDARKEARELRENRKERMKTAREARSERFKADTFDPVQALKQADERRAQWQAERRQIDEKWIAVWNSFDTDQQARVTSHLKDRAERAQKRAEKFEERKKQRAAAKEERAAGKTSS